MRIKGALPLAAVVAWCGCGSSAGVSAGSAASASATESGASAGSETSGTEPGSLSGDAGTTDPAGDGTESGTNGLGSSGTGDGEAPSVYFYSDWGTALGTDNVALLDDAWSDCFGACDGGMEVLSTATEGRDFPTENFLRITCWEGSGGWANLRAAPADSNVPEVQVGQSVFFRWYFRTMAGDPTSLSVDGEFHGTEFWADASRPFGATDYHGMTGWSWSLDVSASPSGMEWQYGVGVSGEFGWDGITGPLQREAVYRLEYGMTRISETQYEIEARIHDVDDALLFETEDFTLAAWSNQAEVNLVNDGPYETNGTEWTTVQDWRLGLNGCLAPYGWGYAEYAAAAICDDWCGPYPIPGVED